MSEIKKEISGQEFLHWRAMQPGDFIRAETLAPGQELVLTIDKVTKEKVTATNGQISEKPALHFKEEGVLPMVANVTNCKIIEKLFGTGNIYEWAGRRIQIFATTTRVGGVPVPCLRVRNYLPKGTEAEYRCSVCGKTITKQIYDGSIAKYGKAYCSKDCVDREKNGKKVDL